MTDPARDRLIESFLDANGFALRDARPLAQDASFRRYLRLPNAILMDAPAPEDVRPFLRIASHLAGLGLSVPRIIAADPRAGLVLEEDLGDDLFATILNEANASMLLDAAIDALVIMHRAAPPGAGSRDDPAPRNSDLPRSDASVSRSGAGLSRSNPEHPGTDPDPSRSDPTLPLWDSPLPVWDPPLPLWNKAAMGDTALGTLFDWWWPATHGAPPPLAVREAVTQALDAMLAVVETGPRALVHRDFFAGNLIWLPYRAGPRRTGIIDFQSAAIGHPAYDLVSLLQDARRDIPAAWETRALARYLAARPECDPAMFADAYAACAAQRHLRVACQWVRLAKRDGRPGYLVHGTRTWRLLTAALTAPAAAPLAEVLDRFVPLSQRRNPPGLT